MQSLINQEMIIFTLFGALEAVSAVILSVTILGQSITPRDIVGGLLILLATTVVVADNSEDKIILHVCKMFPKRKKRDRK